MPGHGASPARSAPPIAMTTTNTTSAASAAQGCEASILQLEHLLPCRGDDLDPSGGHVQLDRPGRWVDKVRPSRARAGGHRDWSQRWAWLPSDLAPALEHGCMTQTTDLGHGAALTLTEAAQACGVSRSTIKRQLDEFGHAYQDGQGQWRVPGGPLGCGVGRGRKRWGGRG